MMMTSPDAEHREEERPDDGGEEAPPVVPDREVDAGDLDAEQDAA